MRKIPELSGRSYLVTVPAAQSLVPEPLTETVLMTQVLVAALLCEPFGMGSGGPNKQPTSEQSRNLHAPPGQSAFAVQALWWFEPPEHRLPPAWAGVVPLSVSVVPLHAALAIDTPMSGMVDGSGTATPAPPK